MCCSVMTRREMRERSMRTMMVSRSCGGRCKGEDSDTLRQRKVSVESYESDAEDEPDSEVGDHDAVLVEGALHELAESVVVI
jgi:hypothetical protein